MKVLHAEQTAIKWDKNLVWNAIHLPEKQPLHRVFYYAAASLLLTVTFVFYSNERTRQLALEVQLKSIEQGIHQQWLRVTSNARQNTAEDFCPANESRPILRKQRTSPQLVAITTNSVPQEIAVAEKAPDHTVVAVSPIVQPDSIGDSTVEPQKVQVIMGQAIARETVNPKSKKFSFRLFPKEGGSKNQSAADGSTHDLVSINNQQ